MTQVLPYKPPMSVSFTRNGQTEGVHVKYKCIIDEPVHQGNLAVQGCWTISQGWKALVVLHVILVTSGLLRCVFQHHVPSQTLVNMKETQGDLWVVTVPCGTPYSLYNYTDMRHYKKSVVINQWSNTVLYLEKIAARVYVHGLFKNKTSNSINAKI